MSYIIKRDGRKMKFDKYKIVDAVLAAFQTVDGNISPYAEIKAGNIADYIEEYAEKENKTLTIEEIQDLVEKGLQSTKRKDVAKEYILYRDERTRERKKRNKVTKEYGEKLKGNNEEKQNANVDAKSFGGRMGEAAEVHSKEYALNELLSPLARENHINNEIYTHDLGSYAVGMHNCLSIPFDDLLANGFIAKQGDVRPAGSVDTGFQLIAVGDQLQSLDQFGGVSATHLDWSLLPYVRLSFWKHYKKGLKHLAKMNEEEIKNNLFDRNKAFYTSIEDRKAYPLNDVYNYAMDMTIDECEQGAEGLYHNLNTLQSRSGNQLPFTSVNYGTCTLSEGRMITKAMLNQCIKGIGKNHKTSIFPCGIFQCMKGVNQEPGEPNYDLFQLAIKSTAKRLYPNYANCDWSGNAGYDPEDPKTYFSTMGCRTANGYDMNGFGQLKDGRGNICPVTIIMPTLAMEAKEEYERLCKEYEEEYEKNKDISGYESHAEGIQDIVSIFLSLLDKKIHEAKQILIERFEYICSQSPESGRFMYTNNTMAGYIPEEGIRSALKHGTLAIGNLGLAETLEILISKNHTTDEGMKLAKQIYKLFADRCAEFKKELHHGVDIVNGKIVETDHYLNFGVYNTPAENLCYTAMTKFHQRWPEVFQGQEFFTNSMHVPVWEELTPIEKIDIESQLTGYSSAGCITYVELAGGVQQNLSALETLVKYAMSKDIPYFAINIPIDTCTECGYTDEIGECCPECGCKKIQRLRRVTGYLTGDYESSFNEGKQQEVKMRYKHLRFD